MVSYDSEASRRLTDAKVRAYVGERLAAIPAQTLASLAPEERARYDRLLQRCEFTNLQAINAFATDAAAPQIAQVRSADERLMNAADAALPQSLAEIERFFDERDAAMEGRA